MVSREAVCFKSTVRKAKDLKRYGEEGHDVFNGLLSLQKVAFCILDKQNRSTKGEKKHCFFLNVVSESVHMSSIECGAECQGSTKLIIMWVCAKAYHGGI